MKRFMKLSAVILSLFAALNGCSVEEISTPSMFIPGVLPIQNSTQGAQATASILQARDYAVTRARSCSRTSGRAVSASWRTTPRLPAPPPYPAPTDRGLHLRSLYHNAYSSDGEGTDPASWFRVADVRVNGDGTVDVLAPNGSLDPWGTPPH